MNTDSTYGHMGFDLEQPVYHQHFHSGLRRSFVAGSARLNG